MGRTNSCVKGGGIDENTLYVNKYAKQFVSTFQGQYSLMRGLDFTLDMTEAESATIFQFAFRLTQIAKLTIKGSTSIVQRFDGMFMENSGLKTIDGDGLDMTSATITANMFYAADDLEDITFVPNSIPISLSLSSSRKLTDYTLAQIVAGLKDLTGGTAQTLTLHATPKARLTAEQIATITAKNWTLA